jgi:hypothetical protein
VVGGSPRDDGGGPDAGAAYAFPPPGGPANRPLCGPPPP